MMLYKEAYSLQHRLRADAESFSVRQYNALHLIIDVYAGVDELESILHTLPGYASAIYIVSAKTYEYTINSNSQPKCWRCHDYCILTL